MRVMAGHIFTLGKEDSMKVWCFISLYVVHAETTLDMTAFRILSCSPMIEGSSV